MSTEIRLPRLGQTMEDAVLVDFLVKVGDQVHKGDNLYEIETDKAALEVESPANGFVKHIFAQIGQTLNVGEPVMLIGGKNEHIPQEMVDSLASQFANHNDQFSLEQSKTPGDVLPDKNAVFDTDIRLGATIPMTRLQKITAQKMSLSKQEKPSFYLNVKVDITEIVELRSKLNAGGSVKVSYNDFIMLAVALACEKFPVMTGRLAGDCIKLPDRINIGLAVSTPHGLIVPVVRDVANKNLMQIAQDSTALIDKAQKNKLNLKNLEGACITISNLGIFGVDSFVPIVIPGQCSIVGVGRITDTCVPDYKDFSITKMMSLTLSVDHKIANGAYAAQFLDLIKKNLEDSSNFQ